MRKNSGACAGLRHLHFSKPRKRSGLCPEGVTLRDYLEREIETATEHPEVVSRAVDYAESQIVSQTDVPCESDLQPGTKLSQHFGFGTEVFGLRIDKEGVRRSLRVQLVPFATAENRPHTTPGVRC